MRIIRLVMIQGICEYIYSKCYSKLNQSYLCKAFIDWNNFMSNLKELLKSEISINCLNIYDYWSVLMSFTNIFQSFDWEWNFNSRMSPFYLEDMQVVCVNGSALLLVCTVPEAVMRPSVQQVSLSWSDECNLNGLIWLEQWKIILENTHKSACSAVIV